jgi:hypothetical protein
VLPPGQLTAATSKQATSTSDTPGSDRGPATQVNLSDHVKAVLARANTEQVVADRLKAFVESRSTHGNAPANQASGAVPTHSSDNGSSAGSASKVDTAFAQLTAVNQKTVTIAGIAASSGTDDSPLKGSFSPTKSFDIEAQIDGFNVSVQANAGTGASSTVVTGPGGLVFNKVLSSSAGISGSTNTNGWLGGVTYGGNNVEDVTFWRDSSASSSVATASSDGSAAAVSASVEHAESITFAIDFSTGSISVAQTTVDTASASQTSQPKGSVSITA